MICSTVFNLYITPVLYVLIASMEDRFRPARHGPASANGEGAALPGPQTETPAPA